MELESNSNTGDLHAVGESETINAEVLSSDEMDEGMINH